MMDKDYIVSKVTTPLWRAATSACGGEEGKFRKKRETFSAQIQIHQIEFICHRVKHDDDLATQTLSLESVISWDLR